MLFINIKNNSGFFCINYMSIIKFTYPPLFASEYIFTPGHNPGKTETKASYSKKEKTIDLYHNIIVDASYKQLVDIHGKENVGSEQGNGVDLAVKQGDQYTFYEFKTADTLKNSIRQALSQLLEYSYFPNESRANKLVIVSTNLINENGQRYLLLLRNKFNIPVFYRRFNPSTMLLENEEY